MATKTFAFLCVLFGAAASSYGQVSLFGANELRAVGVKDRLSRVEDTLKDGGEGARRHSTALIGAFKDAEDWAPAVEDYYARKNELIARAAALKAKLETAVARNSPECADDVTKALDDIFKKEAVLRSDYEFYMRLPRLADGPQRSYAQAAMRLLGQTGDYRVSLAFFLSRTPNRPPFAPLPPGVMAIRHR